MIKKRIKQFIDFKEVPIEKFFEKIGMTSANFRGGALKRPLNSTTIENIFSEYPDLNLEWLITGKGKMLKDETTDLCQNCAEKNKEINKLNAELAQAWKEVAELRKQLMTDLSKSNKYFTTRAK